jgi:hypothetical protein
MTTGNASSQLLECARKKAHSQPHRISERGGAWEGIRVLSAFRMLAASLNLLASLLIYKKIRASIEYSLTATPCRIHWISPDLRS